MPQGFYNYYLSRGIVSSVPTFDLTSRPWVPLMSQGVRVEVSLRDALIRSHEFEGLSLDQPPQVVALLRQVLLPTFWSAVGFPRSEDEWGRWWRAGRVDADLVSAYLGEHADRFDLFHPTQPFAQVGGLRTAKDESKPVSLLFQGGAGASAAALFSARTDADSPALTPPAAARALLAAHCWDTAGIKSGAVGDAEVRGGKAYGAPTGPVGALGVVIPMGTSLFETLMLNTPFMRHGLQRHDRPQWTAPVATAVWNRRPAGGLLDLLTWQSRRIRLLPETDEHGATVVRRVVLCAGDRLAPLPEYEPHTAWRQVDKPGPGDPPRRPIRHQPGRATWRGLEPLLATRADIAQSTSTTRLLVQLAVLQVGEHVPADLPLQVLTVGVRYGNQSAVVEDVMADSMPLPIAALLADSPARQLLLDVADQADQLREAVNRLGDDIRLASGGDKLPWDRSLRPGEVLLNDFTPVVRRLLAGLQREPAQVTGAKDAWRTTARRIAWDSAEQVIAAAPPTAFLGRQQTERIVHRLSLAEARFRATVNKLLGRAGADATDPPPIESGAA